MLFRMFLFIWVCSVTISCQPAQKASHETEAMKKIKALILDGENNHGVWPMTTAMLKDYLEESDLFDVDISRKAFVWQGPHSDHRHDEAWRKSLLDNYPVVSTDVYEVVEEPQQDLDFAPDFNQYDVVISNLGWKASDWSEETKESFENYIKNGGGLVVVHAADNSFGKWLEYNKMIGLGGWDDRSQESGPYVYYNEADELIVDPSEGLCGSHGQQQNFVVTNRVTDHPITAGIPDKWMHGEDELYDRLRGPAENMTVLATAYSDPELNGPPWNKEVKGSGRHEPVLMTIDYGKGKIFHTILGHSYYSMESVGFITTFLRGAEWAATGSVTQAVPQDFPNEDDPSRRVWKGNVDNH